MSGFAGGQTSSTKTVKAICKKNWMQSSKEASHHRKPYADMRTNPRKQCSRNPRCKPWANLVLHNGVAKLKYTPNSLDVQRMLPRAHHCLQFNFSCQLFPVFLMGQPWNWGDGYLESNLTQTKRSPQTRMGNTIDWFCSRKSRKYILLRASYLFPYRHWREKRGAVAVTGYKIKTTHIYIHIYICIPEKGGRKPASKQMLRRRFFLCVLCSACCIWELCATEINFSLLAVSPQQPILLLRLGGLSQKYCMANLRNLVVSRWLEIVFIRPMHSKRMKDQTTQPRVYPGDPAVQQAFAKTFYNATIEYTQTVYTQTLLHTDRFTHKNLYTEMLLHTDAFTHRPFYTQTLLHRNILTQRGFYTQTLLHT